MNPSSQLQIEIATAMRARICARQKLHQTEDACLLCTFVAQMHSRPQVAGVASTGPLNLKVR